MKQATNAPAGAWRRWIAKPANWIGARNLSGFNHKVADRKVDDPFSPDPEKPQQLQPMPHIVVVDRRTRRSHDGRRQESRGASSPGSPARRAAGIHLVLATQRPSVDVITGLIKANIPTRIAFQVFEGRLAHDPRPVRRRGASRRGDMLYLPPGTGLPPTRMHGAFVADHEVHKVVEYLRALAKPEYLRRSCSPKNRRK